MNAAPPVSQAQSASGAVPASASDSAAAAPARAGSQDFAATLSDAGKPARKNVANKHQDSGVSGSSLPAPGNQPPLAPTPPPQAKTDAAAAAGADAAGSVKGATGSAQGSVPSAVAAAPSPPAKADDATTSPTSESLDPVTAPVLAAPPVPAAPPNLAIGVDATATSASGPPPPAASIRIAATPGTSSVARLPTVPAADSIDAKSGAAAQNQGTVAAANTAPSPADANAPSSSTLNSAPATSGADATAQAVVSAAAAQDRSASLADSSSPSDDATISDGGVQPGAATLSDPAAAAAAASVAAMAHAAAASTSAATAATAASIAQALSAPAGVADKRSRSNGTDTTLAGGSTDGSVGAAQLLTSNTSTDSAPLPTFKIAAGVDTAQFGQGVADRVSLMMDSNLTNAKLQVNPPALGPIEVRIALQGGHAQVWLSSHSALTRDALESSSSKLREMLGSQGFTQVSVDISQRSFQERSPQSQGYETAPAISAAAPAAAQATQAISRSASGLLDAYA